LEIFTHWIADYWKSAFEIVLLSAGIYYILLLFRGTRGAAILTGFLIVTFGVVAITQLFQLDVISWILGRFLAFLAIAVVVIFQPELRRALANLGGQQFFGSPRERGEIVDVIVQAATTLSENGYGGLMAVEREIGFRGVASSGIPLDAKATSELLITIFHPGSPLHDGGVIFRGDRIVSAACVFPLTQKEGLGTSVGMRHRAAIGLTEDSDAVVIVISEQNGSISVAQRGHLVQGLDEEGLRMFLATTLTPSGRKRHWLTELLRRSIVALNLRESRLPSAEPTANAVPSSTELKPTSVEPMKHSKDMKS